MRELGGKGSWVEAGEHLTLFLSFDDHKNIPRKDFEYPFLDIVINPYEKPNNYV